MLGQRRRRWTNIKPTLCQFILLDVGRIHHNEQERINISGDASGTRSLRTLSSAFLPLISVAADVTARRHETRNTAHL